MKILLGRSVWHVIENSPRYKYYCGYFGRRNKNKYTHSTYDIFDKFKDKIVMYEWMPEILAGAMGNEAFFIKTSSYQELMEFKDFCSK